MSTQKRALALICMFSMLAASMAGCASSGSASSAPASSSAASSAPASSAASSAAPASSESGEPVSLRMLWWGSDYRHEATLKAIDLYTAKNPNVTIEGEFQGWDGYEEKLATQIAGGTMADIVQITHTRMNELAKKSDVFANLNEYGDILDLSGFEQSFLESYCTVDGKLTALPTGVNSRSFFINKNVCDPAGVQLGTTFTWDEFITEGAKVNQHDPGQYMILCSSDDWFQLLMVYYQQRTGKPIISSELVMELDEEALADGYRLIRRMYDEKVVEPVETSYVYNSGQAENKLWINGQVGCMYFTASSYGQFENEHVDMEPHNPPILADAKLTGFSATPAQVWSVAANDNSSEAIRFLNYILNDPEGVETLGDVRSVPASAPARELLASKNLIKPQIAEAVSQALESGKSVHSAAMQNSEIQRATYDIIDSLAYDAITVEEAVQKTREQYERVLKTMK